MSDLTQRQRDQLRALEALPDDQIDLSGAPEILDWSNAVRGKYHRPGEAHVGRPLRTTTDTSERGLESLICTALTGAPCDPPEGSAFHERPASYNAGWICGEPRDYDREYCVDLVQLAAFLQTTQPDAAKSFDLDTDGPARRKFLARLQGEITKRGTVDVLRKGVSHGPHRIDLMYGAPSSGNEAARVRYGQNRFSVTRQLRYSRDEAQLALDLCLFVNGLPVATFELKNSLTKQTVADAVEQYKRDRNPREKLFELGRCLVHFAVDDHEVQFCTQLRGKESWFLPFNRGWDGGAGNPTNPNGLKTDYLWKLVLTRDSLTDIIENYAQIVETKDEKTGRKRREQLWPRYHQLDVVRELLADASERGIGYRYLIQHSAGSGKSNSIAWLAHQLIGLERQGATIVDSVIVVTDRRVLDRQIRDTIKQFAQVGSVVGHAQDAAHLRTLLKEGKRIVITTVQKFPFILDAIGDEHRGRRFAIIIDEAHSSQGGRTSASVSMALGKAGVVDEDETTEATINRLMESRKLLPNASYFAFTATPKNKTLEIFGDPVTEGGKTRHAPFHSYTMKQAIQERFIIDVLRNYTPVDSYYRLVKTVEGDPEFDTKRAGKKL
ncbi:MAG: type I restriction endonuclease, partial [Gemmatimonadetes bacterium]|nr:type I restriction endonuclease [Gemmatimonadota bacterium]